MIESTMTVTEKKAAKKRHEAQTEAWKEANAERNAANVKRWKAEHPEQVRAQARKDKAAWRERRQMRRAIQGGQALINEEGEEQVKAALRAQEDRDR